MSPTNLPPEYFQVEEKYRAARTPPERIALLEELLSTVPKHKGTEKLRADLRRRLSKLKSSAQTRKTVSRQESAYQIDREGAGQVVVIGPPNSGKSSLVAALTNADPPVSAAPYTTWSPTPGMMPVGDIQVQLIDTPPLDQEYVSPELAELIRRSDLILLVLDVEEFPLQQYEDAFAILEQIRILPAWSQPQEGDSPRLVHKPVIVLVNKVDDDRADEEMEALCELLGEECPLQPISIQRGRYLEEFQQAVVSALDIIRVFSKPPGEEPDLSAPFVLKRGSTIADLAGKVHQDFLKKLKTARVWGSGVHDGQLVGREYVLQDGDVVELRI